MPTYSFKCPEGCLVDRFIPLKLHGEPQTCFFHETVMEQVITPPILVAAQPECRYDSPIDGQPITTHHARQEDLKRHGCIPYDPEQKTDMVRRQQETEAKLDKALDQTVDAAIGKMTTQQRATLHRELVEQGTTAETIRRTHG
jgi:hypothetical protein